MPDGKIQAENANEADEIKVEAETKVEFSTEKKSESVENAGAKEVELSVEEERDSLPTEAPKLKRKNGYVQEKIEKFENIKKSIERQPEVVYQERVIYKERDEQETSSFEKQEKVLGSQNNSESNDSTWLPNWGWGTWAAASVGGLFVGSLLFGSRRGRGTQHVPPQPQRRPQPQPQQRMSESEKDQMVKEMTRQFNVALAEEVSRFDR